MEKPTRKTASLLKILSSSLYDLPTPMNLSAQWNTGSLLGLCLVIQIISGLLLAFHYTPNTEYAFQSIVHITRDVNSGWLLRNIHATGASFFFLCVYTHIGRGIYYGSYMFTKMWLTGMALLLTLMATAFLGYVLPWGQMSYWGATVITNLFSVIPYFGDSLVKWIWGGFTVSNATLNRFFVLHFLLPFLMLGLSVVHLTILHETGSNNPLGLPSNNHLIPFHPFYSLKDLVGILAVLLVFVLISTLYPLLVSDPENFTQANPMSTPTHIQPEWYFLFAYAILRAIPNKMGGVIALMSAVLVLMLIPLMHTCKMRSTTFYPSTKPLFWTLVSCFMLLTWLGHMPTEEPLMLLSQIATFTYFSLILTMPLASALWDMLIFTEL